MRYFKELLEKYDALVFFDTETTGLSAKNCQVIELAMLVMRNDGTAAEYDNFVRLPQGQRIPPKIVELTGITDSMIRTGITETEAAKDFRDVILGGNVLMIAHNCHFDMCFMRETLARAYGAGEANIIMELADWMDSLTVYKDRAAYPHKLTNAIEHYGLAGKVANTHRAIDDTKALASVCNAMDKERGDLMEYVNVFGYNPRFGAPKEHITKISYYEQPYADEMMDAQRILPRKANPLKYL